MRWWPPWRPRARRSALNFIPDRHTLYSAQVLTQQLYAYIINTLRELAGGGMIMLPSSVADSHNPRSLLSSARRSSRRRPTRMTA